MKNLGFGGFDILMLYLTKLSVFGLRKVKISSIFRALECVHLAHLCLTSSVAEILPSVQPAAFVAWTC